ncbi:MAG: hypothetical protein PHS07_00585 [Patescibacteria group bacterium]|nr:hypothetical protein [Patescibacteria group bacterium]
MSVDAGKEKIAKAEKAIKKRAYRLYYRGRRSIKDPHPAVHVGYYGVHGDLVMIDKEIVVQYTS